MNTTYCSYRQWRRFLKLLKIVLVIQLCLFKILLVIAQLIVIRG